VNKMSVQQTILFCANMSLEIVAAAYIYINLASKKKKRRWWQTQLYHSRSVSGGSSLLNDLRGQEMSGQFNNFTRMHSDDYDLLLNLIGPKIARKNTVFREAISVQCIYQSSVSVQVF
jgi:hypothetical protein